MEQYTQLGLRTLCLAWRELKEDEYREWSLLLKEASSSLVDREVKCTSPQYSKYSVGADSYIVHLYAFVSAYRNIIYFLQQMCYHQCAKFCSGELLRSAKG